MSELQIIETALKRAASRRRWGRALRGLWIGLLIGSIISLVINGVYHLYPLPMWTLLAAVGVPLAAMILGFISGVWRKSGLTEVARWVDGRQHLQERLSTALEVSAKQDGGSWRQLIVTDAAQHAKTLDPRRLVQFNLTKAARWALVILLLCAGLGFVPEYRSKAVRQKQADEQVIKEVGRQLTELTRRNLEKRSPALETTQ